MLRPICGAAWVLDIWWETPFIRPAMNEDELGIRKGLFAVSTVGLAQLEQIFREQDHSSYSALRLARIKLCLVEIGEGRCPGITMETQLKAWAVALSAFSHIKLNRYSFNELIEINGTQLIKSASIAYIRSLFVDLKQAFDQGDRVNQRLCVESLVNLENVVKEKELIGHSFIERELANGISLLQRGVDVQKLCSFAEWCVDQLETQDAHALGDRLGNVYSFMRQLQPRVADSFLHKLICVLGSFVDRASTCEKKCELLVAIVESLNAWRDFGRDSLLCLDEGFTKLAPSIVRQEGRKICVDIAFRPLHERSYLVSFLRLSYQGDEEGFIDDIKTEEPGLLLHYLEHLSIEVTGLLSQGSSCCGVDSFRLLNKEILRTLVAAMKVRQTIGQTFEVSIEEMNGYGLSAFLKPAVFCLNNYTKFQWVEISQLSKIFHDIKSYFKNAVRP